MKRLHAAPVVVLAVAVGFGGVAAGQEPSIAELEKRHRDNPISLKAKVDLAEAYLHACQLEKSLALWRRILQTHPDHQRAKYVVGRLTLQALDLDSHLQILQAMIERHFVAGGADLAELLDAASRRAATDAQKARILYLRGLLALRAARAEEQRHADRTAPKPSKAPTTKAQQAPTKVAAPGGPVAAAVSNFQAAMRLYPDTVWAHRAAIALADVEWRAGRDDHARRLLTGVIESRRLEDEEVRESARLALAQLASAGLTAKEKASALREALAAIRTARVKRRALSALAGQIRLAQGAWSAAAVEALGQILQTNPPSEEAAGVLAQLSEAIGASQDVATLEAVRKLTRTVKPADAGLRREVGFLRVEAALARAVIEQDAAALAPILADAQQGIDALDQAAAGDPAGFLAPERKRIQQLRGRRMLVEAQKLVALRGAAEALPVLLQAKRHYLAAMSGEPGRVLRRLDRIARLLEHVQEWEMAISLYREVAGRFPHTPEGRDALLKVARTLDKRLAAPMMALDVYVEYAARYPAELPYRQLTVGQRLRRLGYVNVLDFQKRSRLKVDGLFGPISARKLEEVEAAFDMISLGPQARAEILRGAFVHPAIFKIARGLEHAGRHHDAIVAYRTFLSLFPTKAQADDALLAVARLFRENLLFAEALGAYLQLMADYPKGDMTSEAYIEAAGCLENLGRWDQARQMYELYVRKFPRYKHGKLCRTRLDLLGQIQQYESFIADNPKSPKVAEAQYQIATILYERLGNYTKAAVEFVKVAERHPKHARAPEGLFTAGAAQLRSGNFPAARTVLERLVGDFRESRLADDGQYWIGHTWEYSARALGRLDDKRIVLKRRSLQARARLLADVALRRQYHPAAQPGPEVPQDVWGADTLGLLTSGSKRDRVNADLYRAIRAYRKVVDNFKMGDMAGNALLRIGTIYTQYLKDPERGIKAFQELLAHYPASKEAAGALFEVGAYHLEKQDYDAAIKAYQQFIYNYPRHEKVEDGMLAIARCYMAKKDWNKALDAFQSYLSKFPQGKHAVFAKAQIEWIRMYHF